MVRKINGQNIINGNFFYQHHTFGEDPESHVVVLMPHQKRLSYYFLAAWELEPEGISNKAQFVDYLNSTLNELNNPVSVIVI